MKRFFFIISVLGVLVCAAGGYYYVTTNTPSYFRMTTEQPSLFRYLKGYFRGYIHFNAEGLDRYNAAGSGRLNFQHLRDLIHQWHHKVIVLNGRNETYLYFKDKEIKKYCLKKKKDKDYLKAIKSNDFINNLECKLTRWLDDVPENLSLDDVHSEAEILTDLKVPLLTPLPNDWLKNWDFVEGLIKIFETTPPDTLMYFHCGHGQGRTTTLLTLLDIFHNARDVSLHDIIARQYLLGGENLKDIEAWEGGTWTSDHLDARLHLVTSFYTYMNAPDGYEMKTPWLTWLTQHPTDVRPLPTQ